MPNLGGAVLRYFVNVKIVLPIPDQRGINLAIYSISLNFVLQFRSINLKNEAKERAAASSPPPPHPPGLGPNETDPALDKKPDDDVVKCPFSVVESGVTFYLRHIRKGCVIPSPAARSRSTQPIPTITVPQYSP